MPHCLLVIVFAAYLEMNHHSKRTTARDLGGVGTAERERKRHRQPVLSLFLCSFFFFCSLPYKDQHLGLLTLIRKCLQHHSTTTNIISAIYLLLGYSECFIIVFVLLWSFDRVWFEQLLSCLNAIAGILKRLIVII